MLQSMDCHLGQGHFFGKPMPYATATEYLRMRS
jgi:EAL domain-containing protein (putative c-di-GMP-specific phosphodiesterase class I)